MAFQWNMGSYNWFSIDKNNYTIHLFLDSMFQVWDEYGHSTTLRLAHFLVSYTFAFLLHEASWFKLIETCMLFLFLASSFQLFSIDKNYMQYLGPLGWFLCAHYFHIWIIWSCCHWFSYSMSFHFRLIRMIHYTGLENMLEWLLSNRAHP